jgi:hypothetical protein
MIEWYLRMMERHNGGGGGNFFSGLIQGISSIPGSAIGGLSQLIKGSGEAFGHTFVHFFVVVFVEN